jgi:hypothetical protein
MAHGNDRPDRVAGEGALLQLVYGGQAERDALGSDALWTSPGTLTNGEDRAVARETVRA